MFVPSSIPNPGYVIGQINTAHPMLLDMFKPPVRVWTPIDPNEPVIGFFRAGISFCASVLEDEPARQRESQRQELERQRQEHLARAREPKSIGDRVCPVSGIGDGFVENKSGRKLQIRTQRNVELPGGPFSPNVNVPQQVIVWVDADSVYVCD